MLATSGEVWYAITATYGTKVLPCKVDLPERGMGDAPRRELGGRFGPAYRTAVICGVTCILVPILLGRLVRNVWCGPRRTVRWRAAALFESFRPGDCLLDAFEALGETLARRSLGASHSQ